MAKKNLASLMNGIMGTENSPQEENKSEISHKNNTFEESQPASKGRGRPKTQKSWKIKLATFVTDVDQMKKIKYISLVDDKMQKDILHEALESYIESWEASHGKINLP